MRKTPPSGPDAHSELIAAALRALVRKSEEMNVHPVVAFAGVAAVTFVAAKLATESHVRHGVHHGTVADDRSNSRPVGRTGTAARAS